MPRYSTKMAGQFLAMQRYETKIGLAAILPVYFLSWVMPGGPELRIIEAAAIVFVVAMGFHYALRWYVGRHRSTDGQPEADE